MQEEVLEFIKKEVPALHEALTTDPNEIRTAAEETSREQRFMDAAATVKNCPVKLFAAIRKTETAMSAKNIEEVVRIAALQDDFVTALYWHQKKYLSSPAARLERHYYTLMAAAQKGKDPKAEPIKSSAQMLQHKSEVSAELGNCEYPDVETGYRVCELEEYQRYFHSEEFTRKVLEPTLKRRKRIDKFMSWFLWVGLLLGILFLWKTVPPVWQWAKVHFFPGMIFQLLFWAVPLLYILVSGIIIVLLLAHITESGNRLLKKKLTKHYLLTTEKLHAGKEYLALQRMNEGIPEEYRSYGKRMVLAALSAISGEGNLDKLLKLADEKKPRTWLYYDADWLTGRPNSKVMSLLKEGCSDADRAYAYAVYVRTLDKLEGETSADGYREGNGSDFISQVNLVASKMYSENAYRHQSSRPFNHLYGFLFDFLKRELAQAEWSSRTAVGEICFLIYDCAVSSRVAAVVYGSSEEVNYYTDMAYTYGCYGVSYSDKLKFRVMKNEAVYDSKRNYKLSLGFDRGDARAYMETLRKRGDPRWRELEYALKSAKEYEAESALKAEQAAERAAEMAERAEKARQQILLEKKERERREQLEAKANRRERDIDMALGGSGYTQEERLIRGEMSYADYQRSKEQRDREIEKKVKDF